METLKDIYNLLSLFDLLYILITIYYLFQCSVKGFVLSLLSIAKWILAYIITLILFPRFKPFVKDTIDNQYILDLILGVSISYLSNQ